MPKLDVYSIPHYDSSESSEEENEKDEEGRPKRGPNPKQLKKILDKYNIHTCARNIKEQEKVVKRRKEKLQLDKEGAVQVDKATLE